MIELPPTFKAAFALIETAALSGARCPMNDSIPSGTVSIRALTRNGFIRVEVGTHNWRVVHVLTGPAKGKSTALPPGTWSPYLVSDKNGTRYPKKQAALRARYR